MRNRVYCKDSIVLKYHFFILMLIVSGVIQCGFAATITWSPAQPTTGPADLLTGTPVVAWNGGSANLTVNGITFTPYSLGKTLSDVYGEVPGGTMVSTGDVNFDELINTLTYGGGTLVTETITGLAAGEEYLVQVFYNDQRDPQALRVMTFGDGNGNNINVTASNTGNSLGAADDYGQFATGSFIADGPTQNLLMIANGFSNVHVNAILVVLNSPDPMAILSTDAGDPVSGPYTVDIHFTEAVTGLEESDFMVNNGSITPGSLTGSNDTYAIEIIPAVYGNVSTVLPSNSVIDGENNPNIESNTLVTNYSDPPLVTLSTNSPYVTGPYTVDITFDEPVTGLTLGAFTVDNCTLSDLSGSDAEYSMTVHPIDEGGVLITLPANSVIDGEGQMNTTSNTLIALYTYPSGPDTPGVTIYGKLTTSAPSCEVFLTFSEEVTGLEDSDFQVVNGFARNTTGSGRYYSTTITATAAGDVEVTLPAGAVTDVDGDDFANTVSNTFVTQCTSGFDAKWVVDDANSWTAATASTSNMDLSGGFAEPTDDIAQFTSAVKTFSVKRKALTLTFKQSPVWDNWTTSSTRIGPSDAANAPVFLPVANNDYYFLGIGSTNVYHAWHSTDMVNWTDCGPVSDPTYDPIGCGYGVARWVTSAEYKDGEFYIYSDYPNDHTPHLIKDDNLLDNWTPSKRGTVVGMAFDSLTHGSDCCVFRDDADGLFHIIYEDWNPINARANSWDSPLAGHTSSEDGFNGFDPHEHHPAMDHRTTPTGEIGTYNAASNHYPIVGPFYYNIHDPEQDAFGDWTTIKIGSRFYLFSDYDKAGSGMYGVARWTSDSIYKEFSFIGSLADGHPDPTCGFAEGQFYLITQSNDFTSPGPWVDGVQARAGVDTNGDGIIDEWTGWQPINEQYDYKPGYARVIDVTTPAQLDLSALPEGYGFAYEFQVDNTVVSGVSPIMDRVEMVFDHACSYTLDGDADFDCDVDLVDFSALTEKWLANCTPDCEADLEDLATLASHWLVDCHSDPENPWCVPLP